MAGTEARKRRFKGTVVSDKMKNTVVVAVERLTEHPFYGKYVRRRAKFMAHDEKGQCKAGDKVLIEESRPLSKLKRWRVKDALEKAK